MSDQVSGAVSTCSALNLLCSFSTLLSKFGNVVCALTATRHPSRTDIGNSSISVFVLSCFKLFGVAGVQQL